MCLSRSRVGRVYASLARIPHARSVALTGLLAVSLGCGADVPNSGENTPSVSRENGVDILTWPATLLSAASDASPLAERWTASGHDVLTGLGHAVSATPLADGRVAVLDAMTDEIHVLSADGQHVTTWGGRGEGPNQFLVVTRLFRVGDSLIVIDHAGARASFVASDGAVSHLVSRNQGLQPGIQLLGRTTAGAWVGISSREANSGRDGVLDTLLANVLLLDSSPTVRDTIGEYVVRLAVLHSTPEMQTMVKVPYSPQGDARVAGDVVAHHSGLDFQVTVLESENGRRRVFKFDSMPPPLAADGRADIVNAALQRVTAGERTMVARLWERTPWPEHEGGFIGVHPDHVGGVWVGFADTPAVAIGGADGAEEWLYIDPRGQLGARFRLGPGEQLLGVDDSTAVSVVRDAQGVQSIRSLVLPRRDSSVEEE